MNRPNHPDRNTTFYATHDADGPAEFSTTIVHALADLAGVDVTETRHRLYDSIDPDALDRLFRPRLDGTPRGDGHVVFTVWNYRVTAYSDGRIAVEAPAPEWQAAASR